MTTRAQAKSTKDIKKRLIEKEMTVSALARKLRRSRNGVSIAINHPTIFPKLKEKIVLELAK